MGIEVGDFANAENTGRRYSRNLARRPTSPVRGSRLAEASFWRRSNRAALAKTPLCFGGGADDCNRLLRGRGFCFYRRSCGENPARRPETYGTDAGGQRALKASVGYHQPALGRVRR